MAADRTAPYGTWPSPISAQAVAAQGLRLGAVAVDGGDIYWLEGRPQEGGRNVLVRQSADGVRTDLTPAPLNVRTRVHEYGGGAYVVDDGDVYFSNFADQRLYHVNARTPDVAAAAITAEGPWFYADAVVDRARSRLVCVREDHGDGSGEPVNTLVGVPLGGGAQTVLASGADFYSTPRLDPGGTRLAWLSWNHPQMPWDGTELWVADITASGALTGARRVAGGSSESIYQPGWSADGELYFVSDRDGWWRLYRERDPRHVVPILTSPPAGVEFGRPQWILGTATWAFIDARRMIVSGTSGGRWSLAILDVSSQTLTPVATEWEPREWLAVSAGRIVCVAASAPTADAVLRIDPASGAVETLRPSSTLALDPADVSAAQAIEFPTAESKTAHAFYYAPRNGQVAAPSSSERPPLIVISHGGPTTATSGTLDLRIQFWTTRGFAVVDVNYGGSSGFGRAYRERLNGTWGIVDVADVTHAARHLVERGLADPRRIAIRGGSAGGYTTLAALTFHPEVFTAGASYYGVSDVEVLARDTHKFESRYLDTLIGPYPERRDEYRARSPITHVDRLSCPLILFQGLDDKIVPPNQSEMMADAVRAKGLPVAYLAFPGEQHGFRQAATIIRSLEAELYFYAAVFGFAPADRIEPVEIANLPARPPR